MTLSVTAVSNPITQASYHRSEPIKNKAQNFVTRYYKDGELFYTKENVIKPFENPHGKKDYFNYQQIYRDKNNKAISNHIISSPNYPVENYFRGDSALSSTSLIETDKPNIINTNIYNNKTHKSAEKKLNVYHSISDTESLSNTYKYQYPENNADLTIKRQRLFKYGEKEYKKPFKTLTSIEYNVKENNSLQKFVFNAQTNIDEIKQALKSNVPQKMKVALKRILKEIK